ncbi:hypothetical protein HDU86_005680 [Geranomyces michiganensis]|nr:hypothetical protein HDU86_005680 [Geranomyces michiganensis]
MSAEDQAVVNAFTTSLRHASPTAAEEEEEEVEEENHIKRSDSLSPVTARRPRTRAPSVMDMNFLVNEADVEPDKVGGSLGCAQQQHQKSSPASAMATPSPEPVLAAAAAAAVQQQPSLPIMVSSLAESAKVCKLVTRERRKPNTSAAVKEHHHHDHRRHHHHQRDSRVPLLQPAPSAATFKTRNRQPRSKVAAAQQQQQQQQPKMSSPSPKEVPVSPPSSLVLLTPVASPRSLTQQAAQGLPITMAMAMQALPAVRKRSRISADQLAILNAVFAHTFFPTTEIRLAIARETGLSARTVQVWFQNRRQQWRARNGSPRAVGGEQTAPHPDGDGNGNGVEPAVDVINDQAGKPPPPVKRVMIKATRGRPRLEDVARPAAAAAATPASSVTLPQPTPPVTVAPVVAAAAACERCSSPPANNGATAAAAAAPIDISAAAATRCCSSSSPDPVPSQLPVHIAGWPAASPPPPAHHVLLNYRPFRHARVVTVPDANVAKSPEMDGISTTTRPEHTPPSTPRAGPAPTSFTTTRPTPYPFPTRSSAGLVPVTVPAANAAARRLAHLPTAAPLHHSS